MDVCKRLTQKEEREFSFSLFRNVFGNMANEHGKSLKLHYTDTEHQLLCNRFSRVRNSMVSTADRRQSMLN